MGRNLNGSGYFRRSTGFSSPAIPIESAIPAMSVFPAVSAFRRRLIGIPGEIGGLGRNDFFHTDCVGFFGGLSIGCRRRLFPQFLFFLVQKLQDRNGERSSLSGAGLGAAKKVAAFQKHRDGLFLNGGRLLVPFAYQCLQDGGDQIQFFELHVCPHAAAS